MSHLMIKTENSFKKTFLIRFVIGLMLWTVFSMNLAKADEITVSAVIRLVNQARETADVPVLTKNSLLQKAAQNKAQDMFDNNYFAHISPEGRTPWFWIDGQGYDYRFAGENLAINYTDPQTEQKAWMNSPLHRKNILNPDYKEIGVAVKDGVIDGHKTTITVQMFGAQFPKVMVTATPEVLVKTEKKPAVAGASTVSNYSKLNDDNMNLKNKVDLRELYAENKSVFIGWFVATGIAVVTFIVDMLVIMHKKNEQDMFLSDRKGKHAL